MVVVVLDMDRVFHLAERRWIGFYLDYRTPVPGDAGMRPTDREHRLHVAAILPDVASVWGPLC